MVAMELLYFLKAPKTVRQSWHSSGQSWDTLSQAAVNCNFASSKQFGTVLGQLGTILGHAVPSSCQPQFCILKTIWDSLGTARANLGTRCPKQLSTTILHLGRLTPFGLYNIIRSRSWRGIGSGRDQHCMTPHSPNGANSMFRP